MNYRLECCVWELTLACNLRCIHCGSSAGKKREDELEKEQALKLCEDLKETGCQYVALMGGEPLLSPYFKDIARKIRECGMELSIITNGTFFNDDIIDFIASLSPRAIATSIDGISKTHDYIRGIEGSFDKTLIFIERCLEKKLPVSVITSVSKINIHELNDIAELIKNKNIAWQIQIVGAEGKRFDSSKLIDEDEFYAVGVFIETLRRKYNINEIAVIGAHDMGYNSCFIKNIWLYEKWQGCQAGVSVVGIRSNGDVIGCLSMNDDRFVEGNIKNKTLFEIWNSSHTFTYNRNFSVSDAGPLCRECRHLSECKGGCNEVSLMKTGMLHNDPFCFYRYEKNKFSFLKRMFLEFSSYLWKKRDIKKLNMFFDGKRQ